MDFQEGVLALDRFWADRGCVIWQPHNEKVGAGTANPATVLRVLGPEPWNVAYVEPSVRPADGRYGENPNRWQEYYQYQVILKPAPANNIELYLASLKALGIDPLQHDIRFVEDNWQSPSLGAWGLGWEVWCDGMEITQYTYFQQSAGVDLEPVCLEITYGLERIAMFLQGASSIPEVGWLGDLKYGDLHLSDEIDYCKYNFEHADVGRLQQMYELFELESKNAISHSLVLPAHDYLLRCSHTFNVMDARGAVSATQRAAYFGRMRELARAVASAYLGQRERLGYPLAKLHATRISSPVQQRIHAVGPAPEAPRDLLFEIGTEELPAADLKLAVEKLGEVVPERLGQQRLSHAGVRIAATPRRLVVYIKDLNPIQATEERFVKGPPASSAFEGDGGPSRAAQGFARSVGLPVERLVIREFDGKQYLTAVFGGGGRPTFEVLRDLLPQLIADLSFPQAMRWNATRVSFSRPIRWLVALYGDSLVDTEFAGVFSDRVSYGLRPRGSPPVVLARAEEYFDTMQAHQVIVDPEERRAEVHRQAESLSAMVGGQVPDDADLLDEVTNLVEQPVAIRGSFDPQFLELPPEVLTTVMRKHQRYFPVLKNGALLPYFIAVANGATENLDLIRRGNEQVLRARFADARFFYESDKAKPLSYFMEKLGGLSFQEELGSYADKTSRLKVLAPRLAELAGAPVDELDRVRRVAELAKVDLATSVVIELTSLQGTMGRYYADHWGEEPRVAMGVAEHYLPRHAGDGFPSGWPGIAVGLADRVDTIVGLAGLGLLPSSSADPYGLRRAALGQIQVLVDRGVSLSLTSAMKESAALQPIWLSEKGLGEAIAFVQRRLRGWLVEQRGYRYDLVDAVLAERGDNPYLAYQTIDRLRAWGDRAEFQAVMQAYTRCARIVRGYEGESPLEAELLGEPAARALSEGVQRVSAEIAARADIDGVLSGLASLVGLINTFFEEILVMHEDLSVRRARLVLLQRIVAFPRGVVDLTKVVP